MKNGLIVSASMPRSASAFYVKLKQDLFKKAGANTTGLTAISAEFGKDVFVSGRLESRRLNNLVQKLPSSQSCFIKVHAAPTKRLKNLILNQKVYATYIYRDPRDVIMSALEMGKLMHAKGEAIRYFKIGPYRSFARLQSIQGAVRWFNWQLFPRWKKWTNLPGVHIAKYENLVSNTSQELGNLSAFFNLELESSAIEDIAEKYKPDEHGAIKGDSHKRGRGRMKNRGVVGRYKEYFNEEELAFLNSQLNKSLEVMGYE